jgi:hypothetical protein
MRELRKTFEHLVIILVVTFIGWVIVFAIPANRVGAYQSIAQVAVGFAGPGALSDVMLGVDPQMLAMAVNDDETRAELVDLWSETIPEMEPEALASLLNELLLDPNVDAFLINVVSELDEGGAVQLFNSFVSDPAIAEQVLEVLPQLDSQGLSGLVNCVLQEESTAELARAFVDSLDARALGGFVNTLLADERGTLVEFSRDLVGSIRSEDLAIALDQILAHPGAAEMMTVFVEAVDPAAMGGFLDGVLEENADVLTNAVMEVMENMDPGITASLLSRMFSSTEAGDFLNELLGTMGEADGLLREWLGGVRSGTLAPVLFGDYAVEGDGIMDRFWTKMRLRHVIVDYDSLYDSLEYGEFLDIFGLDLGQLLLEQIVAVVNDVIDDLEIWATVTDMAYQEEKPF